MCKTGDIIEGKVTDFGNTGEGIIKIGAFPVFVPYAIKGETVRAKLNFVKKDYAFGDLIEVLNASESRVKPRCPYYEKCGGCDLQHVDTAIQLEIKRKNIENVLKKNAGIEYDVPLPVRGKDWEYRNKLALPFGYNKNSGRVYLGFFAKKTHKAVPMKWCPLHGEWAADLIGIVSDWANENKVSVYNETTGKGLLRHLVARYVSTMSLTLVINGTEIPESFSLYSRIEEKFPGAAVYISENRKNTNVIFGESCRLVYGKEEKQDLGAYSAVVSPLSFLQVNNEVRDLIYDEVSENLKDFDGDIIELYSGVGLLTAQLALRLKDSHITSVEIVPSAVENARALMNDLGIDKRVECICDDACNFVSKNTEKKKALVLDPPRTGCSAEVLESAIKGGFEKIIYVSCNPATLARDLSKLKEGYELKIVKPFDMFPQTCHVETVTLLSLREPKNGTKETT